MPALSHTGGRLHRIKNSRFDSWTRSEENNLLLLTGSPTHSRLFLRLLKGTLWERDSKQSEECGQEFLSVKSEEEGGNGDDDN